MKRGGCGGLHHGEADQHRRKSGGSSKHLRTIFVTCFGSVTVSPKSIQQERPFAAANFTERAAASMVRHLHTPGAQMKRTERPIRRDAFKLSHGPPSAGRALGP